MMLPFLEPGMRKFPGTPRLTLAQERATPMSPTVQPDLPNDLESYWMPFTGNRSFKKNPRLLVAAHGMHYTSHDGRKIIDGIAGLWVRQYGPCPSQDRRSDPGPTG